jgi:hypothetical protein
MGQIVTQEVLGVEFDRVRGAVGTNDHDAMPTIRQLPELDPHQGASPNVGPASTTSNNQRARTTRPERFRTDGQRER